MESTLLPHRTCDYMYDGSQLFSKFYFNCQVPPPPPTTTPPPLLPQHNGSLEIARAPQVGNAETPELKASRLGLLVVVVNTLKVGFDLLGMSTLDAM